MTSGFWDNVLEKNETLLWTGRPKPRLHWRNWRLYGSAPMAAAGLLAAAWFIIATYGTEGDMWLLILPAALILIPLRATWQQLRLYDATRYALTDQRALFFNVQSEQTRVRAYPLASFAQAVRRSTLPPCVSFIRQDTKKADLFGFDYIEGADVLIQQLKQVTPCAP